MYSLLAEEVLRNAIYNPPNTYAAPLIYNRIDCSGVLVEEDGIQALRLYGVHSDGA